jgi:hypothetical protein
MIDFGINQIIFYFAEVFEKSLALLLKSSVI